MKEEKLERQIQAALAVAQETPNLTVRPASRLELKLKALRRAHTDREEARRQERALPAELRSLKQQVEAELKSEAGAEQAAAPAAKAAVAEPEAEARAALQKAAAVKQKV